MLHVLKIRKEAEVKMNDNEITNLYCALIYYTTNLKNPVLKQNSQKLLDEFAVLMKELGF